MSRESGRKAKYNGANFEGYFTNSCLLRGISCVRIPDGCKRIGPTKLMQIKSPFDFMIAHDGKAAAIDAKSCSTNTWSFDKRKMHQLYYLGEIARQGVSAGFVVHFQTTGKVYFYPVGIDGGGNAGLAAEKRICLGELSGFDPSLIFGE